MAGGLHFRSHNQQSTEHRSFITPKKLFKPCIQTGICVKKGMDVLIKDLLIMHMRAPIISSQTRNMQREAFMMCVASSHQGVIKM